MHAPGKTERVRLRLKAFSLAPIANDRQIEVWFIVMGERRYEKINAFDALQARNDANQLAILRKISLRQAQARAQPAGTPV